MLLDALKIPIEKFEVSLHILSPQEAFLSVVRLALTGGALLSLPVWVREIVLFVRPGLKEKEVAGLKWVFLPAILMLVLGSWFGWSVLLPVSSGFLFRFGLSHGLEPVWTFSAWLGFVQGIVGGAALAFELPVICGLLARIGLLTPLFFKQKAGHLIVLTFVMAALLTPPDVVSQVLLAGPILLLLGISYKVVQSIHRGVTA